MKKTISIMIAVALMLSSFTTSAVVNKNSTTVYLDNGQKVVLTDDQLNDVITITTEEATDIALSFVADMQNLDDVTWNEKTQVISVIPMYDNTNTNEITAYTINLTTGYVVVSAYLDAQALIAEWSDKATALYQELDAEPGEKIIYLGMYEYYVDKSEEKITDLYGKEKEKASLTNYIQQNRDLANIPDSAILNANKKASNTNDYTRDGTIYDPVGHANANYAGPFRYVESDDGRWNNYMDWYTMDYGSNNGYNNHCAPTSITNAIAAYRNRYPAYGGTATSKTNDQIFKIVADYGIANSYFSNATGTPDSTVADYTLRSFHQFNITPFVATLDPLASYNNLKTQITTNNNLLRISLHNETGEHVYGDHSVICYGYNRLRSDTTGYYLTYIEIADGWNTSPRYVLLAPALQSFTTVIDFS